MINQLLGKIYTKFLPYCSSTFHEKRSAKYALSTFRQACKKVPAYKKFLAENKIEIESIDSLESFRRLPLVEKGNYLRKYSTEDLCLHGKLSSKYLIEGSSGLSGERSYWPRTRREDKKLPGRVESLFKDRYQIEDKPTLVIVGLMLGIWVSGEKISWALRHIAINRKYPMSIITPGSNAEEILDIIKKFSPLYQQTIVIAYPPFIKYLTGLGEQENIEWPKFNIKLITGGEYFSEEWRQYMANKLGHDDKDLTGILGIYGASEMSTMMGLETPFSILVKKLAAQDNAVAQELFGQEKVLPAFCQYNPAEYFIESVENELVFTAMTAMPLVRYNIHDRGGVLLFDAVCRIMLKHGYDVFKLLSEYPCSTINLIRFPFLYVWGRSDGSALIYGAVIYPENIQSILLGTGISGSCTGLFKLEPRRDDEHNEYLQLKIELESGIKPSTELETEILDTITTGLEEQNTDYRALRKAIGDSALLEIQLFAYQEPEFVQGNSIKHKYTQT